MRWDGIDYEGGAREQSIQQGSKPLSLPIVGLIGVPTDRNQGIRELLPARNHPFAYGNARENKDQTTLVWKHPLRPHHQCRSGRAERKLTGDVD